MKQTHKYEDIIHLPRPVPVGRSPMSEYDRAAQFSPFAALTGYDAVIAETGRLTDTQIELDEGGKALLDAAMQELMPRLEEQPMVTLRIFCPDSRKTGGSYETVTGRLRKIDPVTRCLVLTDGRVIPADRICSLESSG